MADEEVQICLALCEAARIGVQRARRRARLELFLEPIVASTELKAVRAVVILLAIAAPGTLLAHFLQASLWIGALVSALLCIAAWAWSCARRTRALPVDATMTAMVDSELRNLNELLPRLDHVRVPVTYLELQDVAELERELGELEAALTRPAPGYRDPA